MTDLSASLTVSRDSTHGGTTPLELNDGAVYALVRGGLAMGGVVRKETTVDSEAADGATLIDSRLDMVGSQLVVRVYGTPSQRETRRALLANASGTGAFDQFSYVITATVRGVLKSYRCWPANLTPGDSGALNEFQEMADREDLTVTFMRQPVALSGSF